ncbi:MAG: MBL fold metallo-hydrolase [Pseudomonadales bacterium]|nr:MBL fold metallo-hydrolase [Pseudomonadales bacterium]
MKKLVLLLLLIATTMQVAAEVTVEKLTWAGVKLVHEDTTVFIDAVGTDIWDGNAPGGLVPLTAETGRSYALITHAHNDHFDFAGLKEVLGERGYVIVHEDEATYVASRGLRVVPAKMWVPVARGGFLFTAVPAVDGFGDSQVSWVVSVDGKRYLHAGDTLWHGEWDKIGRQFGPFQMAFLPINGARVLRDPMPKSVASMTPMQAVDANILLRSNAILPIHYGLNDPPYYEEVSNSLELLLDEAMQRNVKVEALTPGQQLTHP